MDQQTLNIQYLYHSGFRIETQKHVIVFDYYKGSVHLGNKHVYVFSSHGHPDHYNPEILQWQNESPSIKYIFSDDICINEKTDNMRFMSPDEDIQIDDLHVKTFGSTDLGVSFLLRFSGLTMFHAGDLNWWHWWQDVPEEISKAETLFKKEVAKMKGTSIDIAFFPVDPRLEHFHHLGADYFIQEISPKFLVPMHFGDDPSTVQQFAEERQGCSTKILGIFERGHDLELQL